MDNLSIFQVSMKNIKSHLTSSNNILLYLEEEKILKNTILNIFLNTTADVQCRIACLHRGDNIRWVGENILEEMAKSKSFDLQRFFFLLGKQIFPAFGTSLIDKRRTLCQGALKIADYGKLNC